jgi:hypothetical protein
MLSRYSYDALRDFENTFKEWNRVGNEIPNLDGKLHMKQTPIGVLTKDPNFDYSQGGSSNGSLSDGSFNFNSGSQAPTGLIKPPSSGSSVQCQQLAAQVREYDRCINELVSKRAVYSDCRKGPAGWNQHAQACLSYKRGKEENEREMRTRGCR